MLVLSVLMVRICKSLLTSHLFTLCRCVLINSLCVDFLQSFSAECIHVRQNIDVGVG